MNDRTEIAFEQEFDADPGISRRVEEALVEIRSDAALEEFRVLHGTPSGRPNPSPEFPLRAAVPVRPRPVPVGRNEFCPCGSGKKFKRCCR